MLEAIMEFEYIATSAFPFGHEALDERMHPDFYIRIITSAVFGLSAIVLHDAMLQFLHVVEVNRVHAHQTER